MNATRSRTFYLQAAALVSYTSVLLSLSLPLLLFYAKLPHGDGFSLPICHVDYKTDAFSPRA